MFASLGTAAVSLLKAAGVALPKVLLNMGFKLLAEGMIHDLVLFSFEKLSQATKTKVDDELFQMVKKKLEGDD